MNETDPLTHEDDFQPSAPVSTGTMLPLSLRHARVNSHSHQIDFDENGVVPTAPPLDVMDRVMGYENVSFDAVSIPPPDSSPDVDSTCEANDDRVLEAARPPLSEKEARAALKGYVSSHCCYGQRAVNNMAITNIHYSSAYHYELQTLTEKRETCWAFAPYGGGEVDGVENGVAPLPWDIPVYPGHRFQDEMKTMPVPHTASVKQCHRCRGTGNIQCAECHGKGWARCLSCHGDGYGTEGTGPGGYKERCFHCRSSAHGCGRQDCSKCNAKGKVVCSPCDSSGLIRCFIQLTVTWKVNSSEHIVERMSLPLDLLRAVSGQVAFEEEGHRVLPLATFPDETINLASVQLVDNHSQRFHDQRTLAQRQQVRIIPVTGINYEWKRQKREFFVYGFENKVYAPDYPQTCCWGCVVL